MGLKTRLASVLLASLGLLGCRTSEPTIVEWHVLAHRVPGEEHGEPKMYWLRQDSSGPRPLTPGLVGFEPQWGVEYRVRVRFSDPKAGIFGDVAGVSSRYFEEVVSETPRPGLEFEVPKMGAAWLSPDRRSFVDGKGFTCAEPSTCETLDRLAADPDTRFTMKLRHGKEAGMLELLQALPADGAHAAD